MPTPEEGSPFEYDFGLEAAAQSPHYDPDRIMQDAIWPTVDYLSRRDWQEEAFIGQDFMFPTRGESDGLVLDVNFHAYCFGIKREDLNYSLLGHNLALAIEEPAPETINDLILSHARRSEPSLMGALDDYHGLVIKRGIQYSFSTEEEAGINAFQAIESEGGAVIWVSDRLDEMEDDEMADGTDEVVFDTDKFYKHDVDNIAMALSILGAPKKCIRALELLKQEPIASDG